MVTFEDTSTPGRGNHTLVKRVVKRELGEPLPVTIGWIGKAKDGGFAYFEPETNDVDPKIVGDSLEEVRKQVVALYKQAPG
jgi:hypothetical protein